MTKAQERFLKILTHHLRVDGRCSCGEWPDKGVKFETVRDHLAHLAEMLEKGEPCETTPNS